ncbi:unnamed protein product [Closterium sp. NIES-64]|nr:unnamed protein product [Closterium sp. NIES-64]
MLSELGRVTILFLHCPAHGRVTPSLPVARPVARDGALRLPIVRPVAHDGALLVVRPEAHDRALLFYPSCAPWHWPATGLSTPALPEAAHDTTAPTPFRRSVAFFLPTPLLLCLPAAAGRRVWGWRVLECGVTSLPSPPPSFSPTAAAAAGGRRCEDVGEQGEWYRGGGCEATCSRPSTSPLFPPFSAAPAAVWGGEGGG